jgi:hypothetical protein
MSSERWPLLPAALALATALAGCADFSRGPTGDSPDAGAAVGEGGPEGAGGDTGSSFAAVVHPLLLSACARCHAEGGEAGDTGLVLTDDAAADLVSTLAFVAPGAPSSSRLVTKMTGAGGHRGGTVFATGTPEYLAVIAWIQQGALP